MDQSGWISQVSCQDLTRQGQVLQHIPVIVLLFQSDRWVRHYILPGVFREIHVLHRTDNNIRHVRSIRVLRLSRHKVIS